ncbi:hypothetical protein PRK78_005672 [Emydomyces testavorans]|uniref:Aminoglycoside phosphotransferase domain-containing protein n=1 Tax=Emydomyces testavorans TaxID=2070801 RepID=A0AAF0DM68_9EURO|nr:hypothetical protein PRK78_005672 [Emydomyces testavorans]
MEFDHVAEERLDRSFAQWVRKLLATSPEQLAMQLAEAYLGKGRKQACQWKNGAFNVCFRVKSVDSGLEAIVRFSALGRTIFRTEKVENEVTVLRYLRNHIAIPVPEVYGSGKTWAGPYIVMSYIDGTPLADILKVPKAEGRPVLNPQISERGLRSAYYEMAKLLLELSKPEFPKIGALTESSDGHFTVTRRPFTFSMNELSTLGNIPSHAFPESTCTFESARDYFSSLASQHMSHFLLQRNDVCTDEADCRKKYVARCLLRKLIQNMEFEFNRGPFRLFCDDFRPSNVLVNVEKICISAAIDWEFTYVAPAEFSYVAPWWLLLQGPEDWESDLRKFLTRYTPRLHLFLDALRAAESDMIARGTLQDSQRLSQHMEKSMDNGLFWLCLAVRHSQMFDEIYWTFIDEAYYGRFISIEDRVEQHLNGAERDELDKIYQIKMEQAKDGKIDTHYTIDDLVEL